MFENIAVGIVIYNPPEAAWSNVSFLVKLKLKVWIIDNSVVEQKIPISGIEFYKYNANNGGLAKALNILCEKASEMNLDWLLTLDQDSTFESEKDLLNLLEQTKKAESDIGILAPKMIQFKKDVLSSYVMTSGTLLRMQAQKECGNYCEYFFIDALDTEYCFRLQSYGWKIKIIDDSLLNHKLGAMISKYIPFIRKHFYITEHSPERLYYIVRNHIITINHYKDKLPVACKLQKKLLFHHIVKIFLYEKSKYAKLKAMLRGFLDAREKNGDMLCT
jgi:rhamnosyltransferase